MTPSMLTKRIDAVLEYKVHHVRTQAGVERYGLPIGSPIVDHGLNRAVSAKKTAKKVAKIAAKKVVKKTTATETTTSLKKPPKKVVLEGQKPANQAFVNDIAKKLGGRRINAYTKLFDILKVDRSFKITNAPKSAELFGNGSKSGVITVKGKDDELYDLEYLKNNKYFVEIRGRGIKYINSDPAELVALMKDRMFENIDAQAMYEDVDDPLIILAPDSIEFDDDQVDYVFRRNLPKLHDAVDIFTAGIDGKKGVVSDIRKNIGLLAQGKDSEVPGDRIGSAARELYNAIRNYPETSDRLYRGIAVDDDELDDFLKKFKRGNTVDVGVSSYSSELEVATGFAEDVRKDNNIMFVLEKGSQSLPLERLSFYPTEYEWINGGRYKVVKVVEPDDSGMNGMIDFHQIYLRQVKSI